MERLQQEMKTCVLIPTLNEAKTIGGLVAKIRGANLDVLVVDDGSRDGTARTARDNGAEVIKHEKNRGKGASLKAGFIYALENGYEAVAIMDGDGQHDPGDINRFIETAQATDVDLVIGNRMGDPMSMPLVRWITNKWMSGFISRACGQHVPDTQCGFRLIKRRVLEKIRLISSKYETESEILIKAGKNRFKILTIPIKSIYKNEVSSIHPIKDAFRFIRLIIKMRLEKKNKG